MSPHCTAQGASLYEAMFTTERRWEARILAMGLDRYSHEATGAKCPDLRSAYLAKCSAARAYFDYLAAMRQAA